MFIVRLILLILGIPIIAIVAMSVYAAVVLRWQDEQTLGLNYYGMPLAERKRFKKRLRFHARLMKPMLWMSMQKKLDFRTGRIQHKGVSGPSDSCSLEGFQKAEAYVPKPEDVFVVTQMKCGTTWMQHVVFQVLYRGKGDLVETGRAMYAISPWLEGRKSIPIQDSKPVGKERPSRIIKTHLPAQLCPFNTQARYIYVARNPISCFASCIDFVVTNIGPMAPGIDAFEKWFTTPDLMWWGTWTDHVRGWWDQARQHPENVLFVYFEDMKKDLTATVRQVAKFLNVAPLNDEELADVVHKCGFAYMQEHQDNFEMHPPHILQTEAEMFVSGSADRHKDVPAGVRERIAQWAAAELASSTFPLAERYPDVLKTAAQKSSVDTR
jgi:hypothetical protein